MPLPCFLAIATFGVGSKIFRAIGLALQKENFTHVLGNAPEKELDGKVKIMNWNVCGIGGGFSYDHGGVIDWRSRLDRIVEKIEQEDPDVLVLQEVYDASLGEALIERLTNRYAHFFFHLGKTIMGSVGGCMVLSKCGIHYFSNTDFSTNNWKLKRGFSILEIKASPQDNLPIARIIGTHLIHTDDEKGRSNRLKQISQIIEHIRKEKLALPTFLAGDLNIERDGEEGKVLLPYLHHGFTQPEPTCTNRLVWQWDRNAQSVWNETIDYISLFKEQASIPVVEKGIEFTDCHLSRAYDENYDTRIALSDHHAVVATVKLA
jgi:endonuclease/exonuclease/phosphatase family metal-dependent hydrolase